MSTHSNIEAQEHPAAPLKYGSARHWEEGRKGGRGRRKRDSVKLQILFLIRSFQVKRTPESSRS